MCFGHNSKFSLTSRSSCSVYRRDAIRRAHLYNREKKLCCVSTLRKQISDLVNIVIYIYVISETDYKLSADLFN